MQAMQRGCASAWDGPSNRAVLNRRLEAVVSSGPGQGVDSRTAAHPGYSDWLLPATYTFVPLPPEIKLAFVLCSTRAEGPISTLPTQLIRRILSLAAGHLRFDGERNVVAPTTKCSSNRDSSRYGFLSPVSKRIARNHRHISLLPYRKVRLPKLLRPVLPCQDR